MSHPCRRTPIGAALVGTTFLFLALGAPAQAVSYQDEQWTVTLTVGGDEVSFDPWRSSVRLTAVRTPENIYATPSDAFVMTISFREQGVRVINQHITQLLDDGTRTVLETDQQDGDTHTSYFEPGTYRVRYVTHSSGQILRALVWDVVVEEPTSPLPSWDVPGQGDVNRNEHATEALLRHCGNGQAGQHGKHCR